MTDPSAESRDRAIAEANVLRQENAQLRHNNMNLRQFLDRAVNGPWSDNDLINARALLAKPRP